MHKGICAYMCLCVREKESESTYMCEILWTPQHQSVYMFILEYNLLCTYSRVVHLNYNYHFFFSRQVFFSCLHFWNLEGTLAWEASELEISFCLSFAVLGWQLHKFCWTLLNVFWEPTQTSLHLKKSLYLLAPSLILIICFQLF